MGLSIFGPLDWLGKIVCLNGRIDKGNRQLWAYFKMVTFPLPYLHSKNLTGLLKVKLTKMWVASLPQQQQAVPLQVFNFQASP